MMQKTNYSILLPKDLLESNIDIELKMGTIMVYCWVKRYGSVDGYFTGNMQNMMHKYGLSYDSSKTKNLPKQAILLIKGFDYLIQINALKLLQGDYHNIDDYFEVILVKNAFTKRYSSFDYSYFDYILNIKKRINKMGMLYIFSFVMQGYVYKESYGKKEYFHASSYTLDGMALRTGMPRLSIRKYLNNLSVEEGYEGDAPLIKSRLWYMLINNKKIRFPNIYVENLPNSQEIIRLQRDVIKKRFERDNNKIEIGYEGFDDDNDDYYYANFDETELM